MDYVRLLGLVQEGNVAAFTTGWRASGLGIDFAGRFCGSHKAQCQLH